MSKKAKSSLQKNTQKKAIQRNQAKNRSDKARRKRALEHMVRELGYDTRYVRITDTSTAPRRSDRPMSEHATGSFTASERGFGFVRVDGRARDIFVPAGHTAGAISGDTVEVRFRSYTDEKGEERTEGHIVSVKEPLRTLIGTVSAIDDTSYGKHRTVRRYTVIPDDRRLRVAPYIDDLGGARIGDKVELTLRRRGTTLLGRVSRIYGKSDTRGANYLAILDDCAIECDFPPEALADAERVAKKPIDIDARTDFRTHTIFTIDGADAKDLDDALSIRRLPKGGWQLFVHIADVSYYVEEKTPLDRAAMRRGTSVYFTDRVVPMLPPLLSNGICSLNVGEDRATLTACITLSADAEVTRVTVTPGVIRSRLRGVYSEINDVLDRKKDSPFYQKYRPVLRPLQALCELYEARKAYNERRHVIELSSTEAVILLDEQGEVCDIRPRERGISERIIEQCMLIAGESVARLMHEKQLPCVYRTHARPPEDSMRDLLTYLHGLGLDIRGIDPAAVTQEQLCRLLHDAEAQGTSLPVSYRILRSMAKATYQPTPEGHFGLSAPIYCHFTAPIRRLSDVAVHRILRRTLLQGASAERYVSYAARAARAAADAELRAVEAERRIDALYKALYMRRFIGEVFDATVSSVASFGLFCTLDNTCEGLLPVEYLGGMFIFDEPTLTLRSRDVRYRIGDRIRVRLIEADVGTGRLRFEEAHDLFSQETESAL